MRQMIVEVPLREASKTAGAVRTQRINLAESPLSWLKARNLVSARQFQAGEILRADYERARLGAAVTMHWDAVPQSGQRRQADPEAQTRAQVMAHKRFDAAMAAAGRGLTDILWRVACACEALPCAEKALGWPTRSGRLVLALALDRLADHYRLADA